MAKVGVLLRTREREKERAREREFLVSVCSLIGYLAVKVHVTGRVPILDHFLSSYGKATTQDILQHWRYKKNSYFIYNGIFCDILCTASVV
jgi:hypothetical protein